MLNPYDMEFDFKSFSSGNYSKALEYKNQVEAISEVLYPDDTNSQNKILRLKQEYFLVFCWCTKYNKKI